MATVKVNQKDDEPQVPFEVLAQDIQKISHAMELIEKTRVSRKLLRTLIAAHTKIGHEKIDTILDCMGNLESIYLKPKPTKGKS